ncbi:hypothetical protein SCALM49S_05897 [Streptomyces californicus]
MWAVFHGLRVAPKPGPSVKGHWPSSQELVLPTTTAPAARSRRTASLSAVARGPLPGAAEVGGQARHVGVVLDGDRYAEERQPLPRREPAVGLGGLGQGRFGAQVAEGVEGGLGGLDTGEGVGHQGGGGGGPLGQATGALGESGERRGDGGGAVGDAAGVPYGRGGPSWPGGGPARSGGLGRGGGCGGCGSD